MRLSIAVVAISSLAGSVSAAFVDTMTVPKTIRSGDGFNLTVTYSAQRQVPFLQERIWIGIIDGPEQYSDLTTLGDSTGSIEITPTGKFPSVTSISATWLIAWAWIICKQI